MSQEIIKIGVLPNDGKGDPLRVAFDKVNHNFNALFSLDENLTQEKIVTAQTTDGEVVDTLRTAIDKLNKNFVTLHTLAPNTTTYKFSVYDPLRVTFEKINAGFTTLFNALVVTDTVEEVKVEEHPIVEVIEPVEPVNDASFAGNINITNNYNFFVSNQTVESLPMGADTPLSIPSGPFGAQEVINVGVVANDGTGDPLRTAFQKINNNFSNLFYTATNTTTVYSTGLAPNQVLLEVPVTTFSQAMFQIQSTDTNTKEHQGINISAQLSQDKANVKFTGYGTTFSGPGICNYDMDVSGGNVRLMTNPLINTSIFHFISSQVTFTDVIV